MIGSNGHRFRIAFNLLALIASAALLLAGWALYARFAQTNELRDANKRVWHAVICSIEAQVAKSHDLTPAKKTRAYRFYDTLLIRDVQTTGCGLLQRKG